MGKFLLSLLSLLLLFLAAPSAQAAGCSFDSGHITAQKTIVLPATLSISRDAPNGTVLWSSGWQSGASPVISCTGTGTVTGTFPASIGAAIPGYTSSHGYPSLFATNVPGIGISVYWCNQSSCNPDANNVTPAPSLSWPVGTGKYPLNTQFWVRLIKYDTIRPAAPLSVAGETVISYINLPVAKLTISGATTINALACTIDADSITVALPAVWKNDFTDASPVPQPDKARSFEIGMLCDEGVQVSYRIDGAQALTAEHVLANAAGTGMAEGVGIQLYEGGASSSKVVALATPIDYANRTSVSNQSVRIPLVARYFRIVPASAIKPGQVSVTATFTLSYQ